MTQLPDIDMKYLIAYWLVLNFPAQVTTNQDITRIFKGWALFQVKKQFNFANNFRSDAKLQFELKHFKCLESQALINYWGLRTFIAGSKGRKRAKNRNNDKGPSESSNQELKNEETVSINQELEYTEETITNTEGFKLRETFSSTKNQELKLTESEVSSSQDLDEKDTTSSKQVLKDLKIVASNLDQQT